jgi:cell division transport system permease protein
MKSEVITFLDWGRIRFFLGEVQRSFTRNAGMQVTAIGTVAVTIVMLGGFLYARAEFIKAESGIFSQILISVYMEPSATTAQEDVIRTRLAKDPHILNVNFVPKREGLAQLRQLMKGQIDTSLLTENPLPDKFRVQVRDPQDVPKVAQSIGRIPHVQNVEYGRQVVQRLLQLAAVIRPVGIAVIVLFLLVAGIIISNTIRLTVFARRREISIMQLVGATNMYIRMPFICEGLLAGVAGAAIAVGALALARASLLPKIALALPWLQVNTVAVDLSSLVLELFAVGAAVGAIASWIAVGRYLRT